MLCLKYFLKIVWAQKIKALIGIKDITRLALHKAS